MGCFKENNKKYFSIYNAAAKEWLKMALIQDMSISDYIPIKRRRNAAFGPKGKWRFCIQKQIKKT